MAGMTITELRYIVALAEERHFGRAAERCRVSQPTLSVAVKKLEEELDVALFERGKHGVQPTPLGERIVSMARHLLDQAAAIKDAADADKDQLEGPLALGTLPTIGPYLLPQFIPLLQETASRLSLYVEEGDAPALAAKLRGGELDAILVAAPFSEADVATQVLFDEPLVLLLPADHPLASKPAIAPEEVDPREVLLLGEGDPFRKLVIEAFPHLDPKHVPPAPGARSYARGGTIETLRHMVATKLGVAIVPQTASSAPLYAPSVLVARPFTSPAPKRTLVLAWRITFPRQKALDLLRRAIQASSAAYWNYSTARAHEAPGVLVENREW
jgi:LysR family hydrogen peroxide-inducible transcriptional activator